MSLAELPRPEGEEEVVVEELAVVVPIRPPRTTKDVCAECLRPVWECDDDVYHVDGGIDHPSNPSWHIAVLREEPEVKWGFLNRTGRDEFKVGGPKATKGGGGMSA